MLILSFLLALDAALHGFLISRFGTKENTPFLVYAIIDAVLAVAVYLAVPYALWAGFILSAIGLIGLTVTFNKPQREKSLDKIIWVVDVAVVAYAAYLLFLH